MLAAVAKNGKAMNPDNDFQYIREVDSAALAALAADERYTQRLLHAGSGARNCTVSYIRTQPGGGSPEGRHVHAVDQVFYLLSGTMQFEIAGSRFTAGPDTVIVFPGGVPHQNWN